MSADGDLDVRRSHVSASARSCSASKPHVRPAEGYVERRAPLGAARAAGGRHAASPSTAPPRAHREGLTRRTSPTPSCTPTTRTSTRAFVRGLFEADGTVDRGYPALDDRVIDRSPTTCRRCCSRSGFRHHTPPRAAAGGFAAGAWCGLLNRHRNQSHGSTRSASCPTRKHAGRRYAARRRQAARVRSHPGDDASCIDRVAPVELIATAQGRAAWRHSRAGAITRPARHGRCYERVPAMPSCGRLPRVLLRRGRARPSLGDEELTYDLSVPEQRHVRGQRLRQPQHHRLA